MFNFFVVLAGKDIAGLPRLGKNSKPHHYQQKVQKKELPKHGVLTKKGLKISEMKKEKKTKVSTSQKPPWNTRPLIAAVHLGHGNQAETNGRKCERSFEIKIVGTLQN